MKITLFSQINTREREFEMGRKFWCIERDDGMSHENDYNEFLCRD